MQNASKQKPATGSTHIDDLDEYFQQQRLLLKREYAAATTLEERNEIRRKQESLKRFMLACSTRRLIEHGFLEQIAKTPEYETVTALDFDYIDNDEGENS